MHASRTQVPVSGAGRAGTVSLCEEGEGYR
jgi:hypothetical protein